MHSTFFRLLILLASIQYDSLSSAETKKSGFDVNDVTFLFALDAEDQPVPNIPLADEIIASGTFSQLMIEATNQWISAPEGGSILRAESWRIMGFRYDPCAPGDSLNDSTCFQELRLTAQSMGSFGPDDTSMHLIYRLGKGLPGARNEILLDLLELKESKDLIHPVSTSGEPLGVHPRITAAMVQGNDVALERFTSFVKKYAVAKNLRKLTMMGLRDGSPIDWIFLGGNVLDGQWAPTAVPNLGGRTFVELNLGGGADVFKPLSEDYRLSMERFFNSNVEGVNKNLADLDRTSHLIENPSFANRNSIDCVSCHSTTSVRLSGNFKFRPSIESITAVVPFRITGFPGPQMLTSHPQHWNLRALGYFGLQPTINMRTVNESARVAETLNTILKLPPPGKDCSLAVEKVMACFVDSSRLFGTVLPKESCLKYCQP